MKEFYWIETAWLEQWIKSGGTVGAIDNTTLLCEHQKVDPTKVHKMKRISKVTLSN